MQHIDMIEAPRPTAQSSSGGFRRQGPALLADCDAPSCMQRARLGGSRFILSFLFSAVTSAAFSGVPVIARSAVRSDVCADAVGKGGAAMGAPAGVVVAGASASEVNGEYVARAPDVIPAGFAATCEQMGWPPAATWRKLSDGMRHWFESSNGSYIYWNRSDGCWWIDEPSGAGVYIQRSSSELPPIEGKWEPLSAPAASGLPQLRRLQTQPSVN